VSARWPGDAYVLGERFLELVTAELRQSSYGFDSPAKTSLTNSSSATDLGGFGFEANDFEVENLQATSTTATSSTGSLRDMFRSSSMATPPTASPSTSDDVEYI
jgi:hypothetical protein